MIEPKFAYKMMLHFQRSYDRYEFDIEGFAELDYIEKGFRFYSDILSSVTGIDIDVLHNHICEVKQSQWDDIPF